MNQQQLYAICSSRCHVASTSALHARARRFTKRTYVRKRIAHVRARAHAWSIVNEPRPQTSQHQQCSSSAAHADVIHPRTVVRSHQSCVRQPTDGELLTVSLEEVKCGIGHKVPCDIMNYILIWSVRVGSVLRSTYITCISKPLKKNWHPSSSSTCSNAYAGNTVCYIIVCKLLSHVMYVALHG